MIILDTYKISPDYPFMDFYYRKQHFEYWISSTGKDGIQYEPIHLDTWNLSIESVLLRVHKE